MKTENTISGLVLIFGLVAQLNAQTTVLITSDFDAAIGYHEGFNTGDGNYGNAIQNAAYVIPGNYGGLNVNRALIHFNLSVIPDEAVIISAKLNLYALGQCGTLPGHWGQNNYGLLQRVIENWSEDSVTWNNQPEIISQNEVVLPASTSPTEDYTNIDVTLLVKEMYSTNNFGFLLREQVENPTNALIFASLDSDDPTKYPTLEITYFENCFSILTSKDAAIGYHDHYNTGGNNYGTAIQNAAYAIPGTLGGLNVNRALIEFDLSWIPTGSIIKYARLNLYALGPSGTLQGHTGLNNNALIQRVTEYWSESTVTWNNQPPSSSMNEVYLHPSSSATQDYLNIEVVELINDMMNEGNYGLILKLVDVSPTNALLFCSSDHPNPLKHPELEICYEPSVGIDEPIDYFQVFPNPARDVIMVKFGLTDQLNDNTVRLYNSTGQLIQKTTSLNKESISIGLDDFPSGFYFIKAICKDHSHVKKFVLMSEH